LQKIEQGCQKIIYSVSAAVAHERTAGALFQTYLRQRIDELTTFDLALHMTDEGQIYLLSTAPPHAAAHDGDEVLLKCINDRVFPIETSSV